MRALDMGKYVLMVIAVLLYCDVGVAAEMVVECEITPQIWELKTPPNIQKSSNLRRATGAVDVAYGEFITLEGVVMDEGCVPVSDAIVEIWQANAYGGRDYVVGKGAGKRDPNFLGTGMYITNNGGYYSFATVMPGTISKARAPHVNIRVRHPDFLTFEGIIYFEGCYLNDLDKVLKRDLPRHSRDKVLAKLLQQQDGSSGQIYGFNVTLDGRNKYKKY